MGHVVSGSYRVDKEYHDKRPCGVYPSIERFRKSSSLTQPIYKRATRL